MTPKTKPDTMKEYEISREEAEKLISELRKHLIKDSTSIILFIDKFNNIKVEYGGEKC